jgi:tetratricopeptide (TPR) repeat protein
LNLQRYDEALKVFDKAIRLKPDDPGLWNNFGDALVDAGRTADAILCFGQMLELDPCHWNGAYKKAILLQQQERFDEAPVCLDICDGLQPGHAPTLHMRAFVLHRLNRFEEALRDNLRAYALDPGNPQICNNPGYDLMDLDRHQEALPWLERALAIQPDFVDALNNKAFSLTQLHRFEEALVVYARSKTNDPDRAETNWSLALLQMLTGNFSEGWAGREARFRLSSFPAGYPEFQKPQRFGGEPLGGKTILLYADEGLGACRSRPPCRSSISTARSPAFRWHSERGSTPSRPRPLICRGHRRIGCVLGKIVSAHMTGCG